MAPIRISSESFEPKDFKTPEEASNSIDLLYNRAELVDEKGVAYPNTASNLRSLTERGKEVTVRNQLSKEEIGTVREED
ncbi:MAG: hypothetical protein SA339_11720 [Methanomassiliicoccus sp.]|nr:hypothetical protein [Methanomassiliicoccus sp.]